MGYCWSPQKREKRMVMSLPLEFHWPEQVMWSSLIAIRDSRGDIKEVINGNQPRPQGET